MKFIGSKSFAVFSLPLLVFLFYFFGTWIGLFDYFEKSIPNLFNILFLIAFAIFYSLTQTVEGIRNFFFISYKESYLSLLTIYLGGMAATILLQRKYPKLDHVLFSILGLLVTLGIFGILYFQFGNS